jgi:hypothetical protein
MCADFVFELIMPVVDIVVRPLRIAAVLTIVLNPRGGHCGAPIAIAAVLLRSLLC